jgi:hypothetical protein
MVSGLGIWGDLGFSEFLGPPYRCGNECWYCRQWEALGTLARSEQDIFGHYVPSIVA